MAKTDKKKMVQKRLRAPSVFPFPFEPYTIQQNFMTQLYCCLEDGQLGIFESPTGTGKSLSVICGAIRWLVDHEERVRHELQSNISALEGEAKAKLDNASNDDWFSQQSATMILTTEQQQLKEQLANFTRLDTRMDEMKTRYIKSRRSTPKFKMPARLPHETPENPEDSTPDDYDLFLLDGDGAEKADSDTELEENKEEDGPGCTKIIYCSRTHSQLSQFVREIQRSPYSEGIRVVSLASRQSYCINPAVQKLRSISLINERCLDMQRNKKGKATVKDDGGKTVKKSRDRAGCPYLNSQPVDDLRDEALLQVLDVEDLGTRGRALSACPYYSSRAAVKDAQVLVVPYNTLLHKETREACGIQLTGNVVIIDEAHNLLDTIGQIHSAEISGHQLTHAFGQLTLYRNRYVKSFNHSTNLYLEQVKFITGRLILMLGGSRPSSSSDEDSVQQVGTRVYALAEFVVAADFDNLNLHTLVEFCKRSKVCQKLQGFAESLYPTVNIDSRPRQTGMRTFLKEIARNAPGPSQETGTEEPAVASAPVSNNSLRALLSFVGCLTASYEDGRVVCTHNSTVGKGQLKFQLLNPASQFRSIINEARSVIVAGGTMKPIEEFEQQLYVAAGANPARIFNFSCGHVIPPENILPIIVLSGPTGRQLDFSYLCRTSIGMLHELGRIIMNVCNVVPAGVVCFFPSYEYEKIVYDYLERTKVLEKISVKKNVFREPKRAGMVESVLADYAASCKNRSGGKTAITGALLFSVIGGKLSEGLNFSDDLGRCILVVGMPYPSLHSAELKAKMAYLDFHCGRNAGQMHYENLCMKAVNQSIGRAVRHKDDYSTVLLLDQRYGRDRTKAALPNWIRVSLKTYYKFGLALTELCKFFASRKME